MEEEGENTAGNGVKRRKRGGREVGKDREGWDIGGDKGKGKEVSGGREGEREGEERKVAPVTHSLFPQHKHSRRGVMQFLGFFL